MSKSYTGINIQWPISQEILSGEKSVETRTYNIPAEYLNKEMLLIETPGKRGRFKSRAIAVIKFTNCYPYKSKTHFYSESKLHLVEKGSLWDWTDKKKWGWKVEVIKRLTPFLEINQRGIVYRKNIVLD